ncbi:TIGR03013 family XrtA/PEP-CTERM system glycosyltransferase [Thauera sinica]|uniref:TIGR03013 family XrtA/PEP-CTERM system glycosyltransferase n=1 Tax=Thauera sinica TaxID=2665146 RepID=A0ABW1AL59_9RHOO|nr:TIGR03013 family XrtA/PEP-CTERM system glycosyltransferase [Thauera sp. K11]ATE62437.1 sugar transferase [Thauera sp. K11]
MLKVFSHYFPLHTLQQALFDAALLFALVVGTIWSHSQPEAGFWAAIMPSASAFAVAMVGLNSAMGLYRPVRRRSNRQAIVSVALSVVVSVPVAYLAFGVLPWGGQTNEATQWLVVLGLGLILLGRGVVNQRQAAVLFAPRVLIIGTGHDALAVYRDLTQPLQRSVDVIGFYPSDRDEEIQIEARDILPAGNLVQLVRKHRVNEIVVAVRERRGGALPLRELLDCKLAGVRVLDLSSFFERVQGQVRVDSLRASWLIYGDGFRQGWARTVVKRCFDLGAAVLLLTVALPVMLLTALFILIEDGAPVFYRQERVGRGGRVFKVIKFRSMRRDAEKDGKPRWATSNDDRVTRVGRIIRKLRIDELPQLFNVIAGEMSLVGPRPERPYFVDQLAREVPFYAVRHCVKPGVTGWAQVRYQYGSSVDDAVQKLQYDLYYVKNHTLVLDVLVLFETVRVVLTGEGAH